MERSGEKKQSDIDDDGYQDEYGIVSVFQVHLEIALNHSHPVQAFEGAQHATRAYLNSYDFVEVSERDAPVPTYRKVRKRVVGGSK